MAENPFIDGRPVRGKELSNRDEERKKIWEITVTSEKKGSVWLTGERQVGKTSLLHCIDSFYKDNDAEIKLPGAEGTFRPLYIYVNCQRVADKFDFYRSLTQGMIREFDYKIDQDDDDYEFFIRWIKELHGEKQYIIFLLDEFDAFIQKYARKNPADAASFLDQLNADREGIEIKNTPQAFACVFASNHALGELTRDLQLNGSGLVVNGIIEIPWFTENQVRALARDYLKNKPVEFSDEDTAYCYKITRGSYA